MTSTTLNVRTDKDLKEAARKLYSDMGLDLSTAVNMFLRQSVVDNGIPFRVHRENPRNVSARQEAEQRIGESFSTADALMRDLLDAD